MIDDKEIRILRAILLDWEYQLEEYTRMDLTLKPDSILKGMRDVIMWMDGKIGDKGRVIDYE